MSRKVKTVVYEHTQVMLHGSFREDGSGAKMVVSVVVSVVSVITKCGFYTLYLSGLNSALYSCEKKISKINSYRSITVETSL